MNDGETPDALTVTLSLDDARWLAASLNETFGRGNPSRRIEYWVALGRVVDQTHHAIKRGEAMVRAGREGDGGE